MPRLGTITGDKQVIRNLKSLADRTQRKILRKVVRRAQKPMIASARRRVRRRYGQLAKSLGTIVRSYRGTNVTAVGGPRSGFRVQIDGNTIDPRWYAHLLEGGHIQRTIGFTDAAGGVLFAIRLQNPGYVRPFPFLGPSFNEHAESAKNSAMAEIAKEIEKEAEREANK